MITADLRGDWAGDLKAMRAAARIYGKGNFYNWALAALNSNLPREPLKALQLFREATSRGIPCWDCFYCDIDIEPMRAYPPFQEFIRPKG